MAAVTRLGVGLLSPLLEPTALTRFRHAAVTSSIRFSHNGQMVTMQTLRDENRQDVLRLAERHGSRNIRVFGSVARGEACDTSDLDLLVEWEAGRSLLDHVGLVQESVGCQSKGQLLPLM